MTNIWGRLIYLTENNWTDRPGDLFIQEAIKLDFQNEEHTFPFEMQLITSFTKNTK